MVKITREEYNILWDEPQSELPGYDVLYDIALIREWRKKAKKWDELVEDNDWNESSGMGKMGQILEWKQKAEKWDNNYNPEVQEWKDKAKKWDEIIHNNADQLIGLNAKKAEKLDKIKEVLVG